MSHRPNTLARPLLAIAMLISSLAMLSPAGVSAAQDDSGLIDPTSYQSPQFGYSLTWAAPWETRERDVITNPGGFDTITLRGDEGMVRISGRSDAYDPLTFLQDTIAIQLASGGEIINQDTTGDVPTAELQVSGDRMRLEVLSLPDAGAIVLVSLRADETDYEASIASAQENIQLNGSPLFGAGQAGPPATQAPATEAAPTDVPATEAPPVLPTEVPATEPPPTEAIPTEIPATEPDQPASTPEAPGSGIEGNSYTSPNFGFSISWDPNVWIVPTDAEYSEDDYDSLYLDSETGAIFVTAWKQYNGNADTCLLGEVTYYREQEGIDDWQVAVDAEGNELTGSTESSAWGVYTNTYTNPDDDPNAEPIEFVDYVECQSLGDGESVVVFHSFALRDDYNQHIGNVLAIVDSLEIPDASAGSTPAAETPSPGQQSATPTPSGPLGTPVPTTGDGTPATDLTGDDAVTGESYPYSFTVPAGWQVERSTLGGDVETTTVTNGTSTVSVQARAMSVPSLADCVATISEEHESQPRYNDLSLARTATGDPFRGEDDFTAFANFTFTGPEGEPWSHFVECRSIVEGQSVLVVTQDVPQELFGSERSARRQIQNSIEVRP